MTTPKRPKRVREQLQLYLDAPDKALLEELVRATGLPRTELFRRGLRSLAETTLGERAPGWSLDRLVGALGDGPDVPTDLAANHDAYLYAPQPRLRRVAEPDHLPAGPRRGKPRSR
jgi:hypothetical protein